MAQEDMWFTLLSGHFISILDIVSLMSYHNNRDEEFQSRRGSQGSSSLWKRYATRRNLPQVTWIHYKRRGRGPSLSTRFSGALPTPFSRPRNVCSCLG